MELRDLEFIVHIARFGGVTRAARDLGVDASTLSRHLGALEDELGILLFERGRGGMKTTVAGRSVLRLAHRAISDIEAIRHLAARSSLALAGELRLAIQTASLGPRLRAAFAAWRSSHPEVDLDLFEVDDREALAGMRERRIGVAIIHAQPTADMEQLALWDERILLAIWEDHHLARQSSVSLTQVRAETVLTCGGGESATLQALQASLLGPGTEMRVQHAGLLDVLNLVAIREGVALMCENHREIVLPNIRYVEIAEADAQVGLVLAWRPALEDPVVGSFVAFMRDWVRRRSLGASAASY